MRQDGSVGWRRMPRRGRSSRRFAVRGRSSSRFLVEHERPNLWQRRTSRHASFGDRTRRELRRVAVVRRPREAVRRRASCTRVRRRTLLRSTILIAQVEAPERARCTAAAVLAVRDLQVLVVRVLLDTLDRFDLRS